MTTPTNRGTFVTQEYRTTIATNEAIKLRYPKARSVEINTQLNEAAAIALAAKVLSANEQPEVFELEVEGIILPDAYKGGVPTYVPEFDKFGTDGREMKLVMFSSNLETGITTIRIRG
ncbi:hypothetical protein ACT9ST_08465 [Sphingobium limneticum]